MTGNDFPVISYPSLHPASPEITIPLWTPFALTGRRPIRRGHDGLLVEQNDRGAPARRC